MQTKLVLKRQTALKLRFQPGATGPAGQIVSVEATTLAPGSDATVVNNGTQEAAELVFGIPEGEKGDTGNTGNKGWSPAFALVVDGARRVLQVDDWVGGEGTKPASGDYVGLSGLTPTIGDAVDIRGPAGTATIPDGDKGDITTSDGGDNWQINADAVGPTELADTAVTPGSYTRASITVDAQGRVTGASSGTSDVANFAIAPGGRLTLASGVPVMSASQAAQTTVYYTPYAGNLIPIYNGTSMVLTVFTEMSQTTTDTTKSPAAVAANKIYDEFVWNDGGVLRCTRGPAWTNATTRGYTLTMVSGVLLNTDAITNGPGALRGTWVGTVASNGSSTIDFIFGAASSGGTAGAFMVWNAYNKVDVGTKVTDTGANYTYTTATVRQARGGTGVQVSYVVGAKEDAVAAAYQNTILLPAVSGAGCQIGVGHDSTTVFSANTFSISSTGTAQAQGLVCPEPYNPAPGTHYVAGLEIGDGTNAITFNFLGSSTKTGLTFGLRM